MFGIMKIQEFGDGMGKGNDLKKRVIILLLNSAFCDKFDLQNGKIR